MKKQIKRVSKKIKSTTLTEERFVELLSLSEAKIINHVESEIKKSEAKVIMHVADHVESEIKKSEAKIINYVGGQFIEHTQKQVDYETGIGVLVESEIADRTSELKTINVHLDDRIKILEGKVAGTESAILYIKKQLTPATT
jgi:hypothetical protein